MAGADAPGPAMGGPGGSSATADATTTANIYQHAARLGGVQEAPAALSASASERHREFGDAIRPSDRVNNSLKAEGLHHCGTDRGLKGVSSQAGW